jgi:hypothetical protein
MYKACRRICAKTKKKKNIVCFGSNANEHMVLSNRMKQPNCKFKFIIPTKKYKTDYNMNLLV